MASAKDLKIVPIACADANRFIQRVHYSGSFVRNTQLHLGVMLNDRLEGVMQFGPPMDKAKLIGLVADTAWNGFIELNRMAFTERLPRNSESRALSVAFRIIRSRYAHLKWVISFADACQCGDGTIYRAAGFVLTGIKQNTQMWVMPTGDVVSRMTMTKGKHILDSGGASVRKMREMGAKPIKGFQLRYIYFVDRDSRPKLTVPIIPFSRIDEMNAKMYRGERAKQAMDGDQPSQRRGSADLHAPKV